MPVREEHRAALRALDGDPAAVRAHLTAGSGLPGPRANLELLGAFADVAPADLVRALADDPDEYLRCCGTCGLGRLVAEDAADARAEPTDRLRARASDRSWRVRDRLDRRAPRRRAPRPRRAHAAPGPRVLLERRRRRRPGHRGAAVRGAARVVGPGRGVGRAREREEGAPAPRARPRVLTGRREPPRSRRSGGGPATAAQRGRARGVLRPFASTYMFTRNTNHDEGVR